MERSADGIAADAVLAMYTQTAAKNDARTDGRMAHEPACPPQSSDGMHFHQVLRMLQSTLRQASCHAMQKLLI